MTSQLLGADYTQGAHLPNYVNGRLLVAEDLAASQQSLRSRDTRIGEAAGAGVVRGLWVGSTDTTLTVTPGLAISRSGEPVMLAQSIVLPLTSVAVGTSANPAVFTCCDEGEADGQSTSLTTGVVLLTARPACRLEGQAPLAPPADSAMAPGCVARWRVEGVEFRAIMLPVGDTVAGVPVTSGNGLAGNRRNLVAHWCLGTEQLAAFGANPFGFDPAYSGFASLDPADLTPCDVPLAVFHWDNMKVEDLDNWSARRRVTGPDPVPSSWSAALSDARTAEGEARFLQFQEEAEGLVAQAQAATAVAGDRFGLLPPVGFLPVFSAQLAEVARAAAEQLKQQEGLADTTARQAAFEALAQSATTSVGYGFDPSIFFGPLGRFGGVIDWDIAEWALHQSWHVAPVPTALGPNDTPGANLDPTRFTYYYIIQNILAANPAMGGAGAPDMTSGGQTGFIRSSLCIVFIANRRIEPGTILPLINLSIFQP